MSYRESGGARAYEMSQPGARLVMVEGPSRGQEYYLSRAASLTAGRAAECDIVLDDPHVSRRHARFYWLGPQLVVEDLGSANGIIINGVQTTAAQALNQGDRVSIGSSVLEVQEVRTGAARDEETMIAPRRPAPLAAPLAAPAPARNSPWPLLLGLLIVGGGLLLVLIFVAIWYMNQAPAGQVPVVTITTPATGVQVEVGAPLTIQAAAVDQNGVTRLELWANNTLVNQQASPLPQGQSPMLVNFGWTPTVAGSYILEVRAFNANNVASSPVSVTITAIAPIAQVTVVPVSPAPTSSPAAPTATSTSVVLPTASPTPIPTFTPLPSPTLSPTPLPLPGLLVVSAVNVRTGPATLYPVITTLAPGTTAVIAGRSADGGWWQIIYPPNSGGLGWVNAGLVQVNQEAASVPIVAGPPLPPTNTPPPPTSTPLPTATFTPEPSAEVSFTADDTTLDQGDCTRLRWRVRNVAAYWVDGEPGVGDEGSREVCDPPGRTNHVLRIQRRDGTSQEYVVTIEVEGNSVPRPEQISPEDDKDFNYYPREVTFVWSAVSAPGTVTYNIQIQYNDGEWHNWRTSSGLTSPTYTMDNFVGANSGRWRVWTTSSSLGDSDKTGWRDFRFLQ